MKVRNCRISNFSSMRADVRAAHIIRRQETTFNHAVSDLKTNARWCLTGTPIQNRLEDLGSLFAFIRASPFHNMATFRRYVTLPFDESEQRRVVATRNLALLLDSLCLRRSRELLHLPEPKERVIVLEFSKEEREVYEETMNVMNRALRQKAGESHSKNTFGLFQIQLQLRILCNHGTYQRPFSWARRSLLDEREAALCAVGSREILCTVCRQPIPILDSNKAYGRNVGRCAHVLCSECLDENKEINGSAGDDTTQCPLCLIAGIPIINSQRGPLTEDGENAYLKADGHSSKMESLVANIKDGLWESKRSVLIEHHTLILLTVLSINSIVFTSWTHTLDLIEKYFDRESIRYSRVDGNCPNIRRQKILDDFSANKDVPILIMTTGTGAFG